jgi:iron complex outermembrane receptor protein
MSSSGVLKLRLLGGSALLCLAVNAAPVSAQAIVPAEATTQAAEPAEAAEPDVVKAAAEQAPPKDIVITGSRIRGSDTTTPAPVSIINPQALEDRGFTQIGQALNELPSITPSFARNTGIGNPVASVQNYPNLFNLGAGRTLSLLNGRRMVTTAAGLDDAAVDTNIIPTGLIERVDIVQAGGAAVYGSGAMAGVINYVLKKNFQGVVIDAQSSISSRGDYPVYSLRGTFGTNFAEGRGNIAVNLEYAKSDALAFPARPISARASYPGTNPANTSNTDGIPATVYFDYTKTWSSSYNGIIWGNTGTSVGSLLKVNGRPIQFNDAGTGFIPYDTGTVVFSNLAVGGDGVLRPYPRHPRLDRIALRAYPLDRPACPAADASVRQHRLGRRRHLLVRAVPRQCLSDAGGARHAECRIAGLRRGQRALPRQVR